MQDGRGDSLLTQQPTVFSIFMTPICRYHIRAPVALSHAIPG